jgi:FAD/FMN-containing dehydrogenase
VAKVIAAVHIDTAEQIADTLRQIQGKGVLVQPWGGGSWEASPTDEQLQILRLKLQRLNRITRLEPADFFVQSEPGVLLADLAAELEEHQLSFPFLSRNTIGSVGGLVGSGQLRDGDDCYSISRWVIAMSVILADSSEAKSGALTFKSVAGYDLPKLFCGSFGTLGVVSEVTLRLYPQGKMPFGKNLQPHSPRLPILAAGGSPTEVTNGNDRIAVRLKEAFDPQGVFPRIAGWNQA